MINALWVDRLTTLSPPFLGQPPETAPGLTGDDVPLYRRWRDDPPTQPLRSWFNVRVGPTFEQLTGAAGLDAKMRALLWALRVDALVEVANGLEVWEWHARAAAAELGRVQLYPQLLCQTYGVDAPIASIVSCWTVNPYVLAAFEARGIGVHVEPEQQPPRGSFRFIVSPQVKP